MWDWKNKSLNLPIELIILMDASSSFILNYIPQCGYGGGGTHTQDIIGVQLTNDGQPYRQTVAVTPISRYKRSSDGRRMIVCDVKLRVTAAICQ